MINNFGLSKVKAMGIECTELEAQFYSDLSKCSSTQEILELANEAEEYAEKYGKAWENTKLNNMEIIHGFFDLEYYHIFKDLTDIAREYAKAKKF